MERMCDCTISSNGEYRTACGSILSSTDIKTFKFCPYCSSKIKILFTKQQKFVSTRQELEGFFAKQQQHLFVRRGEEMTSVEDLIDGIMEIVRNNLYKGENV